MSISLIVGNWKMNTTIAEAIELAEAIGCGASHEPPVEIVVCPPFVSLVSVRNALGDRQVSVGAQNIHYEKSGAYTGEISPTMLAGICGYAIVGHSERRSIFGETDSAINLKIKAALGVGIKPILCVGENLDERNGGNAEAVVESQLRTGLEGVDLREGIAVAYEPVWAIGTGQSASPEAAQAMAAHARRTLADMGGKEAASAVPMLYGGSVNAENVGGYLRQPDIGGALVGGASLNAESFLDIVRVAAEVG